MIGIGRQYLPAFGSSADRLQLMRIEDLVGSIDHAVCMNVLSNIDNYHRSLERGLSSSPRDAMTRRPRFVLVKNEHDLERIQTLRPDLLRTTTALAATPHAALLLRECGVSGALALGDLLSEADRIACLGEAHRLSETWHELLDGEGFADVKRAAVMVRDDLLFFFLHATAAHRAVEALGAQMGSAEFWLFPGEPRPSLWQTEYECSHSVIEAAIHDAASSGAARIEYIRPRSRWHPGRIARRLAKAVPQGSSGAPTESSAPAIALSDHGSEIGWADAVAMRSQTPLALAVGDDISLGLTLGYAAGLDAAGYTVLGASTIDRPVVAAKRIGAGTVRPYFRIAAMLDRPDRLQGVDFAAGRRRFEERRLRHEASAFRNPFLSFQYDHVFSALLPQAARAYTDLSRIIDVLEPSLVIVGSHGFNSQGAAIAARERGVPSVLIQHGGALVLVHSTSADAVWAWGELPARLIRESYGWPEARVAPVGAPQLAHGRRRATDAAHRAAVRQRFAVAGDGKMVLVLTSGCTDGPWQSLMVRTFIDAWDRLLEWASQNPDVTIVLRPHPLMDMCAWYRAVAAKRKNVRIAASGTVDEIVCGADAAVVMECTTTAALVAHAVDCPVVHVRTSRWTSAGDAIWTNAPGLTAARQPAEIADLLDRILRDGAARDVCVRDGRRFFDAYVADDDDLPDRVRAAAEELRPAVTTESSTP